MKDFTLHIYKDLVEIAQLKDYCFQTFEQFIINPWGRKVVVLRHDVDRLPGNAESMAILENSLNVQASYYFRCVRNVWNADILRSIVELNHEVSYHYEDLTITKGNYQKAIEHFEFQLERIRKFYPAKTICMHGSPMSKWDNRLLWTKFDYHKFGIIAEPYFDVDYNQTFYITDTGRSWNNAEFNIRDRVSSIINIKIENTKHLISLFEQDLMPEKVIINTHPHRWFNPGLSWYREFFLQNAKNVVKRVIRKINAE
jgi:hypothetical protein